MSTDEAGVIYDKLKAIHDLGMWILGAVGALIVGGILVLITDHFTLIQVSKDINEMKPRFDRLAWTVDPKDGFYR